MIRFYFHHTPNPMKVALFLEEAGLPYEVVPVDTFKGQQHESAYRAINPNGKTPAIEDDGVRVFDSNAILLYLGDKIQRFVGTPKDRGELLSWLMFVATGLGPYSGQAVHFQRMAPEQIPYAIKRYRFEAKRHYAVLDEHLANRPFMVGDDYSIVDMAAWGWIDRYVPVLGEGELAPFAHLHRWYQGVNARPAVERARNIGQNLTFKADFDDETKRHFFRHIYEEVN
ncbi:MAG: glutathione S-transferase family protein [Candidatus Competibacterales bacterium]